MDIIIVSKTRMSNAACVGGLTAHGNFVRILDENGFNQPLNTEFEVRQVWSMNYKNKHNPTPPHIEDVLTTSKTLRGTLRSGIKMLQIVQRLNAPIWRGSPDMLFDGLLNWTKNGSGFINQAGGVPQQSVGFWISDKPLKRQIIKGKRDDGTQWESIRYNYPQITGWRNLPYVGFEEAIEIIPAGALVRVSLARWWNRNGQTEDRCSLQLSGWYDVGNDNDENEDLPF